ncbi:Proteophosphoglycan 5 [Rhodotorula toruloides ATCC 204091]|uniref:Proteophosphoglycan 5 n=1 Tax=Rhodotorula toruloides TaxID=5286 RepID=A0A0K3CMD7_RHOTO|nr:Proteophosphoglycan 5 [Rhodotorula toruloides ATCC 204091]KAK4335319.1 Proteophosphoglycan 5 [Rhodotorula toruloides]PRQ71386.1 Proteophosphoglycan 5 [Rhodotorula toruloides]
MASDNGNGLTSAIDGSARSSMSTDGSSAVYMDAQEEQERLPGAWPATATTAESGRGEKSQISGAKELRTLEGALASTSLSNPSNASGTAAAGARETAAGEEEVEALADDATTPTLPSTSSDNPRRSSLSRSHDADPTAFPPSHAVFPTRRSFDSTSVHSVKSHPYATAKNHFPLVKQPKKAKDSTPASPSADPFLSGAPSNSALPPPDPSPPHPHRRTSVSSSLCVPSPHAAASPAPRDRTPSGGVFPTVPRTKSTPSGSKGPSPPSSDAASTTSGSAGRGQRSRPPPSISIPPVGSPQTHRTTSPAASQYAPSIAPSARSTATHATRQTNPFKPSYTASLAPSYAELHQATSAEPIEGPTSIFLNPTPQPRSVTELLPKKKLSSFFSKGKSKLTGSSSTSAQSEAARMNDPSYRGKSATILDAALASSATWAQRRGEQSRMPIGGAFGPPAGYRPAHQVLRQQQAREAGGETPLGPAMMGGGTEQPVTGEAIAEAFARNQGRSGSRRMSMVSLQSTADIASPAGGAFPVRREVFATKPRPRPSGEGLQSTREEPVAANKVEVKSDRETEQKGLGIS